MDNQFILEDRLQKIRQIISKYGADSFIVSFSGGKDSMVLHTLLDMAIPNNDIPRVYVDTGIEYNSMREFVRGLSQIDGRVVIIKPARNIKEMLNSEGYPFKSKVHSEFLGRYQRSGMITSVKQYLGRREDKKPWSVQTSCPKCLEYQFTDDFNIPISDKCCLRLKEDPIKKWQKQYKRPNALVGLRREEAGRRSSALCLAFKDRGTRLNFQPLVVISNEWEEWFISEYGVQLCELYKEPYNFKRTGCKGCPFAVQLQQELDVLEKYFPAERKQCEYIWKPIYDEYRRLGYRLRKG